MMDKLMKLNGSSVETELSQEPFLTAYKTPFTGLVDSYINEMYQRDKSERKEDLLKVWIYYFLVFYLLISYLL